MNWAPCKAQQICSARLFMDPQATLHFFKPSKVPDAIHSRVEEKLDHLQKLGITEPNIYSNLAVLILPFLKADGSFAYAGL